jgi:ABC-type nitrate/sulfonate/bicarbonate transport system permease component
LKVQGSRSSIADWGWPPAIASRVALRYAINDARDTLDCARLSATVVVIGAIGFALDMACQKAVARLNWTRST